MGQVSDDDRDINDTQQLTGRSCVSANAQFAMKPMVLVTKTLNMMFSCEWMTPINPPRSTDPQLFDLYGLERLRGNQNNNNSSHHQHPRGQNIYVQNCPSKRDYGHLHMLVSIITTKHTETDKNKIATLSYSLTA